MTIEISGALCIFTAFFMTMILAPFVIKMCRKTHAEQTILEYVDKHNEKQGTPTMGGLMFIFTIAIVTLLFDGFSSRLAIVAVAVTVSYGLLGFLDDFIKVKLRHNLGLKAYQKIIGQLGIAVIISIFCYRSQYIGSSIKLPFTDATVELSWWYIPFCIFIYIATTNAVNLTDGLDGLAGSVTAVYTAVFAVIIYITYKVSEGDTLYTGELKGLYYFSLSTVGALLAFLWHNVNPADVFMGDTGSLALGGIVATLAVFTSNPLLILIVGILYIVSCITVILQVMYFKLTKGKRIFKMAPFHHHLEYSGFKESKIVGFYTIITVLAGVIALVSI